VKLNGTNQTMSGSTSSIISQRPLRLPATTLTFAAGTTQTITNTLTLQGAASNLLSLRSSITAHAVEHQSPGNPDQSATWT